MNSLVVDQRRQVDQRTTVTRNVHVHVVSPRWVSDSWWRKSGVTWVPLMKMVVIGLLWRRKHILRKVVRLWLFVTHHPLLVHVVTSHRIGKKVGWRGLKVLLRMYLRHIGNNRQWLWNSACSKLASQSSSSIPVRPTNMPRFRYSWRRTTKLT